MFGNEDNSIKINVDKGCNGMSEGTVTIGVSEYKEILELAYKAAIIKEAIFAQAALGYDRKTLICGVYGDTTTVAKYLFPEEYAKKLEELVDKKRAEDEEPMEPMMSVKEDGE